MEAFSNTGNFTVSNSAATINANDDVSTMDPDESILSLAKGPRRRQHDEDDSDAADETASLASAAANGQKVEAQPEEEKELPPHACS